MKTLIFIALGGMLGALGRHGVSVLFARSVGVGFPYATMAVNIFGSVIMGGIVGYALNHPMPPELKVFLTVGLLGAFTTFSTFSLDIAAMLQKSEFGAAALYRGVSVICGVAGLFAGLQAGRLI